MSTTTAAAPRASSRGYVLGLLTLVYAFNFIDRQILSTLGPAIKADLGISNGDFGLLTGIVFALFYTVLAIPVAGLADRFNRVVIVAAALVLWSGFTFASAFAGSFLVLAALRVGVAIGEAGGSPPSHSILSDLYPKAERGRALAIYSMGIPFGLMAAFFVAALLSSGQTTDWRLVLKVIGLPGIVVGFILLLTVGEPQRGQLDQKAAGVPFREALPELLRIPSYWTMCLGISFASFGGYAVSTFVVIYLRGAFPEVDLSRMLVMLGVINGIFYAGGTYVGGALADRIAARRGPGAYGWVAAASLLVVAPAIIAALYVESYAVCLTLFAIYIFFAGFYLGPSFSVAQNLARPSVRATSTAVFFFVLNLIALGGGPTVVGYLADGFAGGRGETAGLRLALTTLAVPYALAVLSYAMAARTLPRDMVRAEGARPEGHLTPS